MPAVRLDQDPRGAGSPLTVRRRPGRASGRSCDRRKVRQKVDISVVGQFLRTMIWVCPKPEVQHPYPVVASATVLFVVLIRAALRYKRQQPGAAAPIGNSAGPFWCRQRAEQQLKAGLRASAGRE